MRELVERIIRDIASLDLSIDVISEFIQRINELKSTSSPIVGRIRDEDIQILKIARLLISKHIENTNHRINISGTDWREDDLNFTMIRFWLDDLELNRIIAHKSLGIGGIAYFEIVRTRDFLNFIYDEIKNVIVQIQLPEEESQTEEAVQITPNETNIQSVIEQRRETEILNTLNQFKQFVERDGWRAFWINGSTRNDIKNGAEEIGKCQFMAFLKGFGLTFEVHHNTFQEIQEGAGFSDVIHLDDRGNRFVFELKIWNGPTYHETGITELESYLSHEDLIEGYYIVFDKRKIDKNVLDTPRSVNEKTIHVIQIDIAPIPPTASPT